MAMDELTKIMLLGKTNTAIFALGMLPLNHITGIWSVLIVILDLSAIAGLWIARYKYRRRFTIVLLGILSMHLAVIFKPEDQPTTQPWFAVLALLLYVISLFISKNRDAEVNETPD
jgi:hypothetical protein